MHGILEDFFAGRKTAEEAYLTYLTGFKANVTSKVGLRSKDLFLRYFNGAKEYLQNLKTPRSKVLATEHEVKLDINGNHFVGFIDLLAQEPNGDLLVIDHKSKLLRPRSGRSTPTAYDRELDKYLRQLYLYGYSVKQEFGKFPKKLCFNCFRSQSFIAEPFDEGRCKEVVEWATESIEEIRREEEWGPTPDFFFCKSLCNFGDGNGCEYCE